MSQDVIPGSGSRVAAPFARVTRADAGICLLADHLDAALAAGEDLLACKLTVGAPHSGMAPDDIRAEQAELRGFIDRVRALEMALVSRVLQARRRAVELPRLDDAHTLMLNLLIGGTAELSEAVREVGDRVEQHFLTGSGHLAYLRSRGFIEPEAACLGALADLQVTDAFLVYGRLPLGGLLDLVSAFLDKLDVVFDLYPDVGAIVNDDDDQPASSMAGIGARFGELQSAAEHAADGLGDLPPTPSPSPEATRGAAPNADAANADSKRPTVDGIGVAQAPADKTPSEPVMAATEAIDAATMMEMTATDQPTQAPADALAAPDTALIVADEPGPDAGELSPEDAAAEAAIPIGTEDGSVPAELASGDSAQVAATLVPEIAPVDGAAAETTSESSTSASSPRSLTAALAEVAPQPERLADRLRDCAAQPLKDGGPT